MACWGPRVAFFVGLLISLLGIVLIVIGIVVPKAAIRKALSDQLVVTSAEGEDYEKWTRNDQTDDPALVDDYYFFNITNLDEVLEGGVPVVEEVGPFRFQRHEVKHYNGSDVLFEDGTATFHTWVYYTEYPGGEDLDSEIVTINVAYYGQLVGIMQQLGQNINSDAVFRGVVQNALFPLHYSLLELQYAVVVNFLAQAPCFGSSAAALNFLATGLGTPADDDFCRTAMQVPFGFVPDSLMVFTYPGLLPELSMSAPMSAAYTGAIITYFNPETPLSHYPMLQYLGTSPPTTGVALLDGANYQRVSSYLHALRAFLVSELSRKSGWSLFDRRTAREWTIGKTDIYLYQFKCLPLKDVTLIQQCATRNDVLFGYNQNYTSIADSMAHSSSGSITETHIMDKSDMLKHFMLTERGGRPAFEDYWQEDIPYNVHDITYFKGTFFGDVSTDEPYMIWNTDSLRTFSLMYKGEREIRDIKVNRYGPRADVLSKDASYNAKYNMATLDHSGAFPMQVFGHGVTNMLPLFLSYPHFRTADDYYTDMVDGLHPDDLEHQIYLDVEPNTGAVINARLSLQVNIRLPHVSAYSNATGQDISGLDPNTILPVFWLKRTSTLTPDNADDLKAALSAAKGLTIGLTYVGIIIGGILLLGGLFLIFKNARPACSSNYNTVMSTELARR